MNVLKLGLIGGGAYLLVRSGMLDGLLGTAAAVTPTVTPVLATPPGSPSNPTAPTPINPNAPPPATPSWQLVLAHAGGGSPLLTFDEWNWHWLAVTGTPGPDPVTYVPNRDQKLQVSQWWAFMQQWHPGLSGLGHGSRGAGFGVYVTASNCPPADPAAGYGPPASFALVPGGCGLGRPGF